MKQVPLKEIPLCPHNGKVCHGSRKEAKRGKRRAGRVCLDTYRCEFCGWWHNGTATEAMRKTKHRCPRRGLVCHSS